MPPFLRSLSLSWWSCSSWFWLALLEACGFEAAEALLLAAPPAKPAVPAPIAAPFLPLWWSLDLSSDALSSVELFALPELLLLWASFECFLALEAAIAPAAPATPAVPAPIAAAFLPLWCSLGSAWSCFTESLSCSSFDVSDWLAPVAKYGLGCWDCSASLLSETVEYSVLFSASLTVLCLSLSSIGSGCDLSIAKAFLL